MDFLPKTNWVNGDEYNAAAQNRVEAGVVEGITKAEAALKVSGGSPGAGKVLTSDSAGNATWQDPAAVSIPSNVPRVVIVVTGAEGRQGATSIIWIDNRDVSTRPDNYDPATDMWVTVNGTVTGDTTAPSVPTGLSSSSITSTGFTVSWTASTDNVAVTGYQVRTGSDAPISVSGTSYSFTGLTAGTAYSVTVRARDAAGNWSAWSSALSVTTSGSGDTTAPSVPAGLASSSITSSGFTVSWTASTDNVAVTGYEVFIGGVSYATPSGTSQVVTGRSASTAYSVTVRARDAAGNWSAQSSALSVTTSSGSDTTAPSVPTGLASSSITDSGFTVSWTASTDNVAVTGYEVFVGGVSYATPTGTSQVVTGRAPGTAYSVTVRARDAAGNWSAQSSALSITTGADAAAPSVPTGLASSSITTSGFTVSWTASTDNVAVTGYEVFLDGVSYGTTASTSLAVTGRAGNTAYSVTVRARDAIPNWSAQSSALSVTTLDPLAPFSRFNFNEGSGNTATSVADGYTLTDQTGGSPVWGSGTIKSQFRGYPIGNTGAGSALTEWSAALDFTLNAAPASEKTFWVREESAQTYFNLTSARMVKIYGVNTSTGATAVSLSTPHRIVVTQDATTLKAYLDGTEIISSTEHRDFQRGVSSLIQSSGLDIDIDTFRVWNIALTSGQVSALGA